jgi:hypothetical protein
MNIDELMAQMEADEKSDQRLMSPIEYGRLRGIAPQRVYAAIRSNKLIPEICECGRKCVVKEEADVLFRFANVDDGLNGNVAQDSTGSDEVPSDNPERLDE